MSELKFAMLKICVCIPVKKFQKNGKNYLIDKTLSFLNQYSFLDKIYLYTNDKIDFNKINTSSACEILNRQKSLDKPKI